MISLTKFSERLAYAARIIDEVLRAEPLERFTADFEPENKAGIRRPKVFKFLWKFMGQDQEPVEVALCTTKHKGGLVCKKFSLQLESDVKVEGKDGMVYLTLKRSSVRRFSRLKVLADFRRSDDDPEGLEQIHDSMLAKPTQEESDGKE